MRILTLNMNSHARDFRREKLNERIHFLAEYILKHQVDIVAFQECGQTCGAPGWKGEIPDGFHSCKSGIALKEDNAAALLAQNLDESKLPYDWTWGGVKQAYGKYDEGLAIFSRHPIRETDFFTISRQDAYDNWKTRKVLGASIRIEERVCWFYNVHMGWWQDEEEPFREQMQRLQTHIFCDSNTGRNVFPPGLCSCKVDYRVSAEEDAFPKKKPAVFLLGDFNSPANIPDEGYDMIKKLGWKDTWELSEEKDGGITVSGAIDGWEEDKTKGMRIDYIWTAQDTRVRSSRVIFNGNTEPVISDHFGVAVEMDVPVMNILEIETAADNNLFFGKTADRIRKKTGRIRT